MKQFMPDIGYVECLYTMMGQFPVGSWLESYINSYGKISLRVHHEQPRSEQMKGSTSTFRPLKPVELQKSLDELIAEANVSVELTPI